MERRTETNIDWIERPQGVMGKRELEQLAARLLDLPSTAQTVLIDWGSVTHLDFRGLSRLVSKLRALRGRGVAVLSDGFDSYLLTILRFSLSEEECDLFARCAEGFERPSAGARAAWMEGGVLPLSASGISKN